MKNTNLQTPEEVFAEFVLTNDEMINIRGGDGDPILHPTPPPVKI